jgi:hypothetical protein
MKWTTADFAEFAITMTIAFLAFIFASWIVGIGKMNESRIHYAIGILMALIGIALIVREALQADPRNYWWPF